MAGKGRPKKNKEEKEVKVKVEKPKKQEILKVAYTLFGKEYLVEPLEGDPKKGYIICYHDEDGNQIPVNRSINPIKPKKKFKEAQILLNELVSNMFQENISRIQQRVIEKEDD